MIAARQIESLKNEVIRIWKLINTHIYVYVYCMIFVWVQVQNFLLSLFTFYLYALSIIFCVQFALKCNYLDFIFEI